MTDEYENAMHGGGMPEDEAAAALQEEDPIRKLQREILDAALPHICFEGWTRDVLARAAADLGYPEAEAERAFPRGPVDAILAHAAIADADMEAEMQTLDLADMRTRDKIAIAIRVRLESQMANRDAIAKGMRFLADPRYAADGAKSLAETVDTVWRIAGDTSTDFNYYTKRGLLAGVYSATLVYWLNDNSEDQRKTWEFLNGRIADILRFGQATAGLGKTADRLPNPFRLCGGRKRRWREGPVHY